ncbi:MAG: DUF350 domain-containing protein [Campylobacterota bacterium]|nr:DUF350 domain-containing protein [Campylobacterota bacterium]
MEYGTFWAFILFFSSAIVLLGVFLYLYALITPYDDYELIFQQNNKAAAIGFGGSIMGVTFPIYSALVHSISYFDFLIWGAIAICIQLLFALFITRFSTKFNLTKSIEEEKVSVGIIIAFIAISIGLINAGSMSY